MAANDEFPRGLTLTAAAGGGASAAVTFPAATGVTWIVDYAELQIGSASGAAAQLNLSIAGGFYEQVLIPAAAGSSSDASLSMRVPGQLGAAMTVSQSAANPANVGSVIVAHAFPI